MSASVDFSNGFLAATDNASLDITGALTVFAWFRREAGNSQNYALVAKWQNQTGATNRRSYALLFNFSNGFLRFNISSDGTASNIQQVNDTAISSQNVWYFAAGVYVPSTSLTLYRGTTPDGITQRAQNTTTIYSSIHSGAAPLWIARLQTNGSQDYNFRGLIPYCGVVAQALTLTDLKEIAHGRSATEIAGANVKAEYRLYRNDAASYADLSGNGNDVVDDNGGPGVSTIGPPIGIPWSGGLSTAYAA